MKAHLSLFKFTLLIEVLWGLFPLHFLKIIQTSLIIVDLSISLFDAGVYGQFKINHCLGYWQNFANLLIPKVAKARHCKLNNEDMSMSKYLPEKHT